jgi:hypothetical protein
MIDLPLKLADQSGLVLSGPEQASSDFSDFASVSAGASCAVDIAIPARLPASWHRKSLAVTIVVAEKV